MPVLTLLAVIPSVFLLIKVYQADKVEKEPAPLLFKLFIKGLESAFFAAVVEALLINFGLNTLVHLGLIEGEGSFLYHAIEAFLIVAVAEEGFKYYFLKKITWNHPAFDYRFDAVVYAVFVSLGFATIENILYVWGSQIESGTGLQLSVYRGVLSVPAHCVFAVAMGIHYGAAKYAQGHEQFDLEEAGLRKAFLVPVLMHGFFDFALMMNQPLYTGLFFLFVILADYRALKAVGRASQTDTRVYKAPSLTPPVQAVSYVQTTAPSQRPHVPANPAQTNNAWSDSAQADRVPTNPAQKDRVSSNPAQADRVPSNPAQADHTPTTLHRQTAHKCCVHRQMTHKHGTSGQEDFPSQPLSPLQPLCLLLHPCQFLPVLRRRQGFQGRPILRLFPPCSKRGPYSGKDLQG